MVGLAVVGAQWGDEGKGKIVDWLSDRAEIIVRFQGGHNAGHTLVIGDNVIKLSLLPSGIMRSGKLVVIGNGVVLNPWALLKEIEMVGRKGIEISRLNLLIAENVCLILPPHEELDKARERNAGIEKIGTTGRGIGPAYEDKVGRRAIRLSDIFDEESLDEKLSVFCAHHDLLRDGLGMPKIDKNHLRDSLSEIAKSLQNFCSPVWKVLSEKIKNGSCILYEGAQGSLLDVDFGTYPYVTSSNTVAAMASIGSGVPPLEINSVLGIVKAYTTRVGEGPFPTEIFDRIGAHIADVGKEKGTVTGRDRRCGWFDSVLVRQTGVLNGLSSMALTKLDVLDDLDEIKICTGYRLEGQSIDFLPLDKKKQGSLEPIYQSFPGWKESTYGKKKFAELPLNAVKYIRKIEELTDIKVSIVSTSPKRDDTILIKDPYV